LPREGKLLVSLAYQVPFLFALANLVVGGKPHLFNVAGLLSKALQIVLLLNVASLIAVL